MPLLLEPDRRGEPAESAPDDDDLHRLSR
jgi:hypothetical protein